MENWVADSKRGPLQHAPEGSAATLNKRRVRRCDKRHPATHWETPERVAHTTLPPRRDNIKSGVAQGCPLSPLLFLVVAEGLRISLDMQTGFKGIQIGGKFYKISQFADDTTLMMRSVKEIKAVEAGLKRWCRATGMKENVSKREGLAMGSYRHTEMPEGIELSLIHI